jgi:hypothetical protein
MKFSDLLDDAAAGRYLGDSGKPISRRALQHWRQFGLGPPFIRVGRRALYRKDGLERWLHSRTFRKTADEPKWGEPVLVKTGKATMPCMDGLASIENNDAARLPPAAPGMLGRNANSSFATRRISRRLP